MDGLNRKFKEDPVAFMRRYAIVFDESVMKLSEPKGGLADFDWRPFETAAKVAEFSVRGKDATAVSHRIHTYWLPWKSKCAPDLVLGSEAKFFFTSQLGGCQLRIVPATKDSGPRVVHIAGDGDNRNDLGSGGAGKAGSEWRDQQAQKVLGSEQYGRSRALSSTGNSGNSNYGNDDVTVIGFVKDGAWEFWSQYANTLELQVKKVERFC
ncbi:MAG TPA: hypothetical protein VGN52_21305 [Burkholderiales bacterium]